MNIEKDNDGDDSSVEDKRKVKTRLRKGTKNIKKKKNALDRYEEEIIEEKKDINYLPKIKLSKLSS